MSKRGFNSSTNSKSAESRSNNKMDGDDPDGSSAQTLSSTPLVNGQRKKLTDLKIDFNFVPNAKNNASKLKTTTSGNNKKGQPAGGGSQMSKTPQPKIRGVSTNNGSNHYK